jgi:hypothetical protein
MTRMMISSVGPNRIFSTPSNQPKSGSGSYLSEICSFPVEFLTHALVGIFFLPRQLSEFIGLYYTTQGLCCPN